MSSSAATGPFRCGGRFGSPRSQPSETRSTTGPPWRARRVAGRRSARSASPIRVPPDQSGTDRDTAATAESSSRGRSSRVIRVRVVENRNASTRRWRWLSACAKCRSIREYRSIDPLTSHNRRIGRGRRRRSRRGSEKTSPPVRTLCRNARRKSRRGPDPRIQRRVCRSPGFQTSRASADAGESLFLGRELREVLGRQPLRVAPGPQPSDAVGRRAIAVGLRRWLQKHPAPSRLVSSVPERIECAIEDREVVVAMHQ